MTSPASFSSSIRTFSGWVRASFVLDVFSLRIVGRQVSTRLRTDLAPDALNTGLWTGAGDGQDVSDLVHRTDRGVQYVAVRCTWRMAEAGTVASVGTVGDSYDSAMAEPLDSVVTAELARTKGSWRDVDDLKIAFAKYID